MSKVVGNRKIVKRSLGRRIIIATYLGLKLIWQALNSCFGGGFWDNLKPWDNISDGWNNGKK